MTQPEQPDASEPRKVTVDNQTVEKHALKDQLDAADRTAAKQAVTRPNRGLLYSKFRPGGAV